MQQGEFWICGPFKEAHDKMQKRIFNMEQQKILSELLEEDIKNKELMKSNDPEEQLIASLAQLDIDKRIDILLGIPNGNEEKDDEIFREAIFESFIERTEE